MANHSKFMKAASSWLLILGLSIGLSGQPAPPLVNGPAVNNRAARGETFTNPLLPQGSDPWAIYKGGYYYYMQTTGDNLTIWKVRNLADLNSAQGQVVWKPRAGLPYSKDIWAPELHFLKGKWYIYRRRWQECQPPFVGPGERVARPLAG
jgi:hypothetical protein